MFHKAKKYIKGRLRQILGINDLLQEIQKTKTENQVLVSDLSVKEQENRALIEGLHLQFIAMKDSVDSKFNATSETLRALALNLSEVSGGIKTTQEQMNAASAGIESQLGELSKDIDSKINSASASIESQLGELSKDIDSKMNFASASIESKLDRMSGGIKTTQEQINSASASIESKLGELSKDIDSKMNSASASIESKLDRMSGGIKTTQEQMNAASASIESQLGELSKDIDSKMNSASANIESKLGEVSGGIKTTQEQMNAASVSIESKLGEVFGGIKTTQEQMNAASAGIESQLGELSKDIDSKMDAASASIELKSNDINKNVEAISSKYDVMNITLEALHPKVDVINNRIGPLEGKTEQLYFDRYGDAGINYLEFENQFRGSIEDIKQRFSLYLPHFSGCASVLDIGCGRGEMLSLLRDHNIPAKGVDLCHEMVEFCHKNGLDVIEANAFDYLGSVADNSVDAVFLGQIVEHLGTRNFVRLTELCRKKLKSGGVMLYETLNPEKIDSLQWFFMDFTHVFPIHPVSAWYVLKQNGWSKVDRVETSHPEADYAMLAVK